MRMSKNKNIRHSCRGINEYKKGYQSRSTLVKNEKSDLLAGSHSILNRWKNHFCQLLHADGFNDVRQIEIHTAEPPVPEPVVLEGEMAAEKLKRYKSAIDQIPGEPSKS
jgi:hypothetical protein